MLHGSLHSSPSPTWQQWAWSESPFPLVRWWHLSLHPYHNLYCLPLFHYDPLLDRNKIMDVIKPPSTKLLQRADLILISPKPLRRTTHNTHNSFSFNSTSLTLSSHLRHLGIILDSRLFLEHHTKRITTKIRFHLKTSPISRHFYLFPPVKVTHSSHPDWTTATASQPHHPPHNHQNLLWLQNLPPYSQKPLNFNLRLPFVSCYSCFYSLFFCF